MKNIWFRVGMVARLTDMEYNELLANNARGNMKEVEATLEKMAKTGELSGETYIVGKNNGGVEDYDNPNEEISVLF